MVRLGLRFLLFGRTVAQKEKGRALLKESREAPHKGLYHGETYVFGYRTTWSGKKTPRVWKPNVFEKTFYSQVLEQDLSLKVSVPALRCIDKAGGLDNYIINTPERTLHSKLAIDLKKLMVWVVKCKEEGVEMEQIRSEVFPKPRISRHVHIPKEYTNRFYFDWKGPRKQMVFC